MLTDNEIIKTSGEISSNKIKAIYPHIVVGANDNKPYYSIQWYDVDQKMMIDGYGSYKLEFVRKWLKEDFEVIEEDIGDFINRQKAEIKTLQERNVILRGAVDAQKADNERLQKRLSIAQESLNTIIRRNGG